MDDQPLATKSDILTAVDAAYGQLGATLDRLDDPHAEWPEAVGFWSVIKLLQHLDGWLGEMHEPILRLGRGERPVPDGTDYSNVDGWNAKFVEVRGEQTLAEARAAFERAHAAFREALETVDDERYGDGRTVNRIAYTAAIEHYQEHDEQIVAFLTPDSG